MTWAFTQDAKASEVFAGEPGIIVYVWDAATQSFSLWVEGLPSFAVTFDELKFGTAYWILADGPFTWGARSRPHHRFDWQWHGYDERRTKLRPGLFGARRSGGFR